ncbi:uncharacterized, partial [Tachysurus ichikawai]
MTDGSQTTQSREQKQALWWVIGDGRLPGLHDEELIAFDRPVRESEEEEEEEEEEEGKLGNTDRTELSVSETERWLRRLSVPSFLRNTDLLVVFTSSSPVQRLSTDAVHEATYSSWKGTRLSDWETLGDVEKRPSLVEEVSSVCDAD